VKGKIKKSRTLCPSGSAAKHIQTYKKENMSPNSSEHPGLSGTGSKREAAPGQEISAVADPRVVQKDPAEKNPEAEPKAQPSVQQMEPSEEHVPILLPPPPTRPELEAQTQCEDVDGKAQEPRSKTPSSRAPPSTLISSLHNSGLSASRSVDSSGEGSSGINQEAANSKGNEGTMVSSLDGWETE
jgi:hypothetical protein